MTERQRQKLEWLSSNASAGYVLDDNDRCEVRAALADLDAMTAARDRVMDEWIAARADLDACRAALDVLRELKRNNVYCPECQLRFDESHAFKCRLGAVLAAGGEEQA